MSSVIIITGGPGIEVSGNEIQFQVTGMPGPQGDAGPGVPIGGTPGQVLTKQSATDYDTEWAAVIGDGESLNPVQVSADHTTKTNEAVFADATASTITISFPTPAKGDHIVVSKVDSSANTVTCPGNIVLNYQNSSANLLFDGSVWRII